ncbi:endonuclease [Thiotrichales bacterium 19S11-10]|nr:endonuclease [Thiotrichales bacterium 19S11-10]
MKRVVFALIVLLPLIGLSATKSMQNNESFSKSKKVLLKDVYYDHQYTFYCDVPYEIKRTKGKEKAVVDPVQEGFHYRKNKTRASRIEWEHVFPAEQFGGGLACWYKGDDKCVNSKGKAYKGRRCCTKVSAKYRLMQADMHNLVPAIGEVNGDRSNYRYMDTKTNLVGQYGACPFKVDFKERKAYPAEYTKGFIGRDYLYMSKKYDIKLSKQQQKMMEVWAKYPESDWEKERVMRINKLING